MVKNQNTKNTKKTTVRKKRRTPKPKVYIAPYKIIILCVSIITICMILLLTTTLISKPETSSIADRYEENVTEEKTIEQTTEKDITTDKKKEKQEEKKPAKKQENKKQEKTVPEVKKPEQKKEPVKEPVKEHIKENKALVPVVPEKQKKQEKIEPKKTEQTKADFNFPKANNDAQLIFVFDDGGGNLNQAKAFLDLPFPFTVAVLPRLQFSKETADLIRNSGNEVILHQPMQALNLNVNPGEGAIKPDMSEEEIKTTLFQNVTEVGPIAGMNNHEGSAISEDAEKMATVLQFCSSEGIFFLDSRTNPKTSVPYVAKELGYPYYERNIFLDNEKTRENIMSELKKGLDIANKKGSCIMIGHIWSADILPKLLVEVYPELKEKGYTFSVVSKSKAEIYN